MCLSIGTPKITNFPFVPNGKFIIFRCPKIWAHYSLIVMCSNIETPNNHHFPFGTNVGVMVLGVPILKHFRVNVSNYRRSRGRAFRAFKLVYMYAHTPPISIFLTVPRRYFRCGSSLLFLCLFVCNLLAV